MFHPKRPAPSDEEGEILAEEKAFLESLNRSRSGGGRGEPEFVPAATVVRIGKPKEKEAQQKEGLNLVQDEDSDENENDNEPVAGPSGGIGSLLLEEPSEVVVESEVVEKEFDPSKLMEFSLPKAKTEVPSFKKSLFAKGAIGPLKGGKKGGKSLFAQMFDAKYRQEEGAVAVQTKSEDGNGNAREQLEEKAIGDQIHPYLAGMTEREIVAEQKKLVERLDPKLIEFLRSRSQKKEVVVEQAVVVGKVESDAVMKEVQTEEKMTCQATTMTLQEDDLPIDPKAVKEFPGMGKVELEKLEWAGIVKEDSQAVEKLEEGESARFDFYGNLLSGKNFDSVETFERGLHHHGEEMEKPGYTIDELLFLSRSVNCQQKARALQIIGNIYKKAHTGIYDLLLDNLFELWEYMDFMYAIRKGLDEENKTLINEASYCLAGILYPNEEEVCLDVVYSWENSKPHPWLSMKRENVNSFLDPTEDERELTDVEALQADLLDFLINRTNLLDRLAFFLEQDALTEMGVNSLLKILVRVARHSPTTLVNHRVFTMVVSYYTSPNLYARSDVPTNLRGIPLWMAFKVLRILVDSSCANARTIYNDFNIFSSIMAFLTFEDWKCNELIQKPELLVLESFRIWISLISQGIAIDEYQSFYPVLLKFLLMYQTYDPLSTFDILHSGSVFGLLLSVLRVRDDAPRIPITDKHSHWALVKDVVPIVEKIVIKYFNILGASHLEGTYDHEAIYGSLSRGILFLLEAMRYNRNSISRLLESNIGSFLSTSSYDKITSNLRKHSVILSPPPSRSRYPRNFASVGVILFAGKCNPIIRCGNGLPLLTSILRVIKAVGDEQLRKQALKETLTDYVNKLVHLKSSSESLDFFVRFELSVILELTGLYPPRSMEQFYLAYKVISEAPKCCPKMFNTLFNIAISCSCEEEELQTALKIYGGYLLMEESTSNYNNCTEDETPIKKVKFSEETKTKDGPCSVLPETINFERWSERCIDYRWILEPMHRIRIIVATAPGFLAKNLDEIELQCKICLSVIDKCLKRHCDFVIQTPKDFVDVYHGVCQVFLLGDPRTYIGEQVNASLVGILQSMLSCSIFKKLRGSPIFSAQKSRHGHPNFFFDLYSELIKEYSENSYFNQTFANYLLLPLRVSEDWQLRHRFWLMETITFFRLTKSQGIIPLEDLIVGPEKSATLMQHYLMLLHSGKVSKRANEYLFDFIYGTLNDTINAGDENIDISNLKEQFLKLKL